MILQMWYAFQQAMNGPTTQSNNTGCWEECPRGEIPGQQQEYPDGHARGATGRGGRSRHISCSDGRVKLQSGQLTVSAFRHHRKFGDCRIPRSCRVRGRQILSAFRIVASRWAIIMAVRPSRSRLRHPARSFSGFGIEGGVASSRIRMDGSRRMRRQSQSVDAARRELDATITYENIQPFRKLLNELHGIRRFNRPDNFGFGCMDVAISDIVPYRPLPARITSCGTMAK
ncbi:MAG: hypothetical protein IPJ06_19985 [Saprospiraceae bacterium]|nr:hypothetical protein [Saprospiraceae bacterium]